ncbi:MAG: thioesterase family protein [Acidobacteriota bacterium]
MHEYRTTRRVEFVDTDMARIVHFSRFFPYMEAAEHECLRQLLGDGQEVHFEFEGREIGWPRVRATCDYRSPARLGDVLDVRVYVKRIGGKSLTWGFDFSCGKREIASGEITAICCRVDGESLEAIPIPPFLAERLSQAPVT